MSGDGSTADSAVSEDATSEQVTCSARGCSAPATVDLRWNNPKLHPPERRKSWHACDEHDDHLSSFLSARGFLREKEPVHS